MAQLLTQNFPITPTPSGVVDFHFPNGNDGGGGTVSWSLIPSGPFVNNQQGTPISFNLFTLYLTQTGGAVASLASGTLGTGWSLSGAGVLSYSGTGIASGTISVAATLSGHVAVSNLFNYSSIQQATNPDTNPPTVVTGVHMVSNTTTSITVAPDVPCDSPTASIPSSGLKQINWYKGGVFDGSTAYAAGLQQSLTELDVAASSGGGGTGRAMAFGHYLNTQNDDRDGTGRIIDNRFGPALSPYNACEVRYSWKQLWPNGSTGTPDFSQLDGDLAQIQARATLSGKTMLCFVFIGVRSYNTENLMPVDLIPYSNPYGPNSSGSGAVTTTGTLTGTFTNGSVNITNLSATSGSGSFVVKSAIQCSKIPNWGQIVTLTGTLGSGASATMDQPATSSGTATISFASPPGGWMGWRWDTGHVLPAYKANVATLGARYSAGGAKSQYANAFGGICTQETSTGGGSSSSFSDAAYQSALQNEHDYINLGCPNGRHLFYYNQGIAHANLFNVLIYINGSGTSDCALVGGPDCTPQSTGLAIFYQYAGNYHSATGGIKHPGYTFSSIQPGEWSFNNAGAPNLMENLYNFCTSSNTYNKPISTPSNGNITPTDYSTGNSPLKCDFMMWNYKGAANPYGQQSDPTIASTSGSTGIAQLHNGPIGTLS